MADAKPTALVLADILVKYAESAYDTEAAAELRRQHDAIVALSEALRDLELNVCEAMKTGGWVPTPLHQSFWQSMSDARATLTKHGVKQ